MNAVTRRLVVLALFGLALAAPQAQAKDHDAPATLKVGVFGNNMAAIAAFNNGYFADENLTVQFFRVSSSTQQFQALRDGEYDLINTAVDNVANYALNENNPLGASMPVQMIAGTDLGWGLGLFTRPQFTDASQLAGTRITVDAPDSGFAFILYKILSNHGLERGIDYNVVSVGGVFQRFQSLLTNQSDATLLVAGFDTKAELAGMNRLDHVNTIADPYLSTVWAGLRPFLHDNKDVAIRFLRAYLRGVAFVLDPANKATVVSYLVDPTTSAFAAEKIYQAQLKSDGIIADGSMNPVGIYNVLKLREEYNGFDQPQNLFIRSMEAGGLYDTYYLHHAQQSAR